MNILRPLDNFRRDIMPRLTKNIGKNHFRKIDRNKKTEIRKVLIVRPNHRLGNLLLTTPLVQEIIDTFPNCEIDILAKGTLPPVVFKNYDNISSYIVLPRKPFKEIIKYIRVWISTRQKGYDLVINAVKGSSSGKLLTKFAKAKYKIFGEFDEGYKVRQVDHEHIAKNPIYNLRHYLEKIGYHSRNTKIPILDLKLDEIEVFYGHNILSELVDNSKKTICIFTYATGAKCYSKTWWLTLYSKLKKAFPEFNIIEILPIENVSQIDFKAPTFYSKDIREITAVIGNSEVFLGADSGIMHLASSSLTPTIGLFSITDIDTYGPYNHNNVAINTNVADNDVIIRAIKTFCCESTTTVFALDA